MEKSIRDIIQKVQAEMQCVAGVIGVVLGGSRARGTHHANSDIDIGIYYDVEAGFDVNQLSQVAAKLDDEHRENLVTPIGGWGPWVNAGGWLVVDGYHVDFILRDVRRVVAVIDDCLMGKVSTHYQAGHPHGYINVMYMGEVAVCAIISDPQGIIAELKARTHPYPQILKEAMVDYYMFEASFSLMHADHNVDKDDLSYVCGHAYRTIACLNQVLFALNEEYCINEKRAVSMIESFSVKPPQYKDGIERAVSLLSKDPEKTRAGLFILQDLVSKVEGLVQNHGGMLPQDQ